MRRRLAWINQLSLAEEFTFVPPEQRQYFVFSRVILYCSTALSRWVSRLQDSQPTIQERRS
jgi:hypothetical protein